MSDMIRTDQSIEKMPSGRIRVISINKEPTMTQQQFADDCDINNIMAKYEKTGQVTHLSNKQGVYGDFSDITDYQDMLHRVAAAQESFQTLPAKTRQRFQNDPGELISFLQDRKNYDEAISLGLIVPNTIPEQISDMNATQTQNTRDKNSEKKQSKKAGTDGLSKGDAE